MITNRFFVGDLPNLNMTQIYDIVVGEASDQFISLDGTKIAVKLPEGDENTHGVLNSFTEYDYAGIKQYILDNYSEWNPPN
jgi:hypothetical protein